MDRQDQKGPERPRPPLWVGDEPVQTVGDPVPEHGTLPNHSAGDSVGFWQLERPVHPDFHTPIHSDPG